MTQVNIEISATDLKTLRAKIRKANTAYYSGSGRVTLTDSEYDALLSALRRVAPNDPLLHQVGAPPTRGKKVKLPIPMPSLPKVKVDSALFDKWLEDNPGPYTLSDKLDGVSGQLNATPKGLKLYTRGDGSTGTDISHLTGVLKGIGTLRKGQVVRGEIIVTTKSFTSGLSKDFANQRNLASAIVNKTKIIHPDAHKATFVVHEMMRPKRSLAKSAKALKARGFIPVPHKVLRGGTSERLTKYLATRTKNSKSDIDGLVIEAANGSRVALKAVNEVAIAKVKEVLWSISRYGKLKPVVHFVKPVTLAGAKIYKATAHNAKFIKDNKVGPGAMISVIRSGEVIPKITQVLKGTKAQLPKPSTFLWDKNKTDIISTDDTLVDQQQARIMVNFLNQLGIKSFKSATMATLISNGLDSVEKLMKVTEKGLANAGLKGKRGVDLFVAITEQKVKATHIVMMAASGKFPAGFGTRRLKVIMEALGPALFKGNLTPSDIRKKLMGTSGIGSSVTSDFMKGLPGYRKFLRAAKWYPTVRTRRIAKTKLTGKRFVMTGFRDADLQTKLELMGANVGGGVSAKTNYLITPDSKGTTLKLTKARNLGVKIITPQQAWRLTR